MQCDCLEFSPIDFFIPTKAVIPAKAGIHWHNALGDSCLRRNDGKVELLHFSTPAGVCPRRFSVGAVMTVS